MQSLEALVSSSGLFNVPFQLHMVSITTMMLILFTQSTEDQFLTQDSLPLIFEHLEVISFTSANASLSSTPRNMILCGAQQSPPRIKLYCQGQQ